MSSGEDPFSESRSTELDVESRMALDEDQSLLLHLRLRYDAGDPFAITLLFLGENGPLATWQFSRDVLSEGLHKASGLGDVRIWPPCPCHDPTHLRVSLKGAEGSAVVHVPAEPVRSWLSSECFALVPAGTESELIDWDVELAHLTGRGI
ncbi:SsgA family sporulation/cell division regulator [Streptacidiphilus fuscans]|uniref:SsgA family sporulation/cell division regulator n=1 Tax=Streptacidiphilus fuscans TaxID=2789292 RepID=A0A931AXS9_9ACTN|nr:SsgA family sporulation/cell division regulator [Streptacidiphilus fuscans]MBF9066701.1 SsgA family sporulation/cell division regulator [Streptacidiphilus fuscans]